jgi:protein-L-isoaspartate(D-aspartate) O-methyltransferase
MDRNEKMIRDQIVARGITEPAVLEAFRKTPRELFVPPEHAAEAYDDGPLPIGGGQTISQPFIVAYMTEKLALQPSDRVLELGTGSVYQTAILSRIASHVYTAEIVPRLADQARRTIERLGLQNVTFREGDALEVFRDEAPFDAILAAAAPSTVPEAVFEQLADGGRALLPVGDVSQSLVRIVRVGERFKKEDLIGVRFVPLTRG